MLVSLDEHNTPTWMEKVTRDPDIDHHAEFIDRVGFETIVCNPELQGVYRGTVIFSSTLAWLQSTMAKTRRHKQYLMLCCVVKWGSLRMS